MKFKYVFERCYPYIVPIFVIFVLIKLQLSFINNSNLTEALDGVLTMCSLIIGFLGAILPVILGMKNESKIVKYVFEKDTDKLFLKYLKSTLFIGIVTSLITITMYFKDEFVRFQRVDWCFWVWLYLVIAFLLLTYRCTSNILDLLFTDDLELVNPYMKRKRQDSDLEKQEYDIFNDE